MLQLSRFIKLCQILIWRSFTDLEIVFNLHRFLQLYQQLPTITINSCVTNIEKCFLMADIELYNYSTAVGLLGPECCSGRCLPESPYLRGSHNSPAMNH